MAMLRKQGSFLFKEYEAPSMTDIKKMIEKQKEDQKNQDQ
jgi:hypothetical protein